MPSKKFRLIFAHSVTEDINDLPEVLPKEPDTSPGVEPLSPCSQEDSQGDEEGKLKEAFRLRNLKANKDYYYRNREKICLKRRESRARLRELKESKDLLLSGTHSEVTQPIQSSSSSVGKVVSNLNKP